jgi:hypothetical protein
MHFAKRRGASTNASIPIMGAKPSGLSFKKYILACIGAKIGHNYNSLMKLSVGC